MSFLTKNILWIDTETSGIDPNKNFLFQLAYFGTIDGEIVFYNNLKMRPKNLEDFEFSEEGYKKHQVSLEEISHYELEEKQLQTFIKDTHKIDSKWLIAGYNVGFDIEFLKALYSRNNALYNKFFYLYYDVMQVCIGKAVENKINPENFQLETIKKYFNIELPGNAHDAFNDVATTIEVSKKLFNSEEKYGK